MTDKALEAAYAVAGNACKTCQGGDACNGFECRIAFEAAISAYLSALPGEAEVVATAWDYMGEGYVDFVAMLDKHEIEQGRVTNIRPLVTLASLQAMQARAEKAERERDESQEFINGQVKDLACCRAIQEVQRQKLNVGGHARAEAAEARVKELEAKLSEAADEIEGWGAYASEYFQEKHDLPGVVREFREFALKGGSNG